jgi:hypothetical protein
MRYVSLIGVVLALLPISSIADDICSSLLSNGIRDATSTDITESRFSVVKGQVCNQAYDSYAKASSQAAGGGFDLVGVFGINGSTANAESVYSTKWQSFCKASYAEASSNYELKTFSSTINQRILASFDRCVELTSERFIRYVEPSADGRTFVLKFFNKRAGDPSFKLEQLTLLDTTTGKQLDPRQGKDCDLQGSVPYDTKPYNVLTILCQKDPTHEVRVNAKTTAGPIDVVSVPAVPKFPPSLADRLVALEGQVAAVRSEANALSAALQTSVTSLNSRVTGVRLRMTRNAAIHDIAANGGEGDCTGPNSAVYGFRNSPVANHMLDMWRCVYFDLDIPPIQ